MLLDNLSVIDDLNLDQYWISNKLQDIEKYMNYKYTP